MKRCVFNELLADAQWGRRLNFKTYSIWMEFTSGWSGRWRMLMLPRVAMSPDEDQLISAALISWGKKGRNELNRLVVLPLIDHLWEFGCISIALAMSLSGLEFHWNKQHSGFWAYQWLGGVLIPYCTSHGTFKGRDLAREMWVGGGGPSLFVGLPRFRVFEPT